MRWPILTIAGITAAVLIGMAHASFKALAACVFGEDDIHADGYGNR